MRFVTHVRARFHRLAAVALAAIFANLFAAAGPAHADDLEAPLLLVAQPTPDLYVAIDRETVDRIIENDASSARFVAGLVAWDAGELEDELKRGLWFVQEPEANIVMQKRVEGLWEELVARAERRRDGI